MSSNQTAPVHENPVQAKLNSKDKLPTGTVKVEVESKLDAKIGGPMDVTLKVNGNVAAQCQVSVRAE